jgi:hypothetical protein
MVGDKRVIQMVKFMDGVGKPDYLVEKVDARC